LPQADGFAVKVYLYGLYLCENTQHEFSVKSMSEVLNCSEVQIKEAFAFWEDYDLVQILAQDPFTVQYLPVRSLIGKPKKIRYEQYADFNKELQRKLQKVGKFVSPNDYLKYMHFLEETSMQPQALLLVAEYCINKQGEDVSPSYIFNKAKKLIRNGFTTYEQVEKEISDNNANEGALLAVFNALSLSRSADESDYALYKKWTDELGFTKVGVLTAAKKLKKGSVNSLDLTLVELYEKHKTDEKEIEEYLTARESLASLTFRIGRKLGVKVQNPAPYIDEYVEKWYTYGFEENSILDVALLCMRMERGSFDALDSILEKLFKEGAVSKESVKEYLKEKNDEIKLLTKMQEICATLRKTETNLSLIRTWRSWNFSDEMILEATKRSSLSGNPLPYMNKILSDWKKENVFSVAAIPEQGATQQKTFVNANIEAANAKSDRERYYALLREKAMSKAEKYLAKANENARFKEITAKLSKMEFDLAKAEVFSPATLPSLEKEKAELLTERKSLLSNMGIKERQLSPEFTCEKCSDTGFLKSGVACDCYKA
ncbi:MAG: DnaD domain protein, partial [Clostridia bacterium]|nr:DnaD domain protein [Clostridia bacterium]